MRPESLQDALNALAESACLVLCGATDVYPAAANTSGWGGPGLDHPDNPPILDISAIGRAPNSADRHLREVNEFDDRIEIGALVRWSDIATSTLGGWFDALRQAAREVGGRQIQNRATVAGNLCNASPAADGVPPLLALDARVRVQNASTTREVPLGEFILGNRRTCLGGSDLLTAIVVPKPALGSRSAFAKLGARKYLVISIAMVAIWIELEPSPLAQSPDPAIIKNLRIAVGACSEVAIRLKSLEAALVGSPVTSAVDAIKSDHFDCLSPIEDVRGSADYRRDSARILVARTLQALTTP